MEIKVASNEIEAKEKRYYTHVIVSYASREELQPLLNNARHYALVLHDKDETDKHFHILATFEREKSFAWVRKQVKSEQNTFTEFIKGDVQDVIDYFQHKELPKAPYRYEDIEFDDLRYWEQRMESAEREVNPNDQFVDDLLDDKMNHEKMARKYGRDYLKNITAYEFARDVIMRERETIKQNETYSKSIYE